MPPPLMKGSIYATPVMKGSIYATPVMKRRGCACVAIGNVWSCVVWQESLQSPSPEPSSDGGGDQETIPWDPDLVPTEKGAQCKARGDLETVDPTLCQQAYRPAILQLCFFPCGTHRLLDV